MKSKRKILTKSKKSENSIDSLPAKLARYVVLKPAGYPLRISGEETISASNIVTDNPKLFNEYSVSQWGGLLVERGDFLFDSMIFPDFAFRVVKVHPNPAEIGLNTKIELETFKKGIKEPLEHRSIVKFSDIIGNRTKATNLFNSEKYNLYESTLLQIPSQKAIMLLME